MTRTIQGVLSLLSFPLDYPTRELIDCAGSSQFLGRIPATVYQTWETRQLTRRLHRSVASFRGLNPELSFRLYDAQARDAYMKARWGHRDVLEIYANARFGPLKADIFRYCILFDYGGFYFDISKGVSRPLRDFVNPDSTEMLSCEGSASHRQCPIELRDRLKWPDHLVAQWGFGFAPRHRILEMQIERIEKTQDAYVNKRFANPKSAVLEFSGPIAFTESVWAYLAERDSRTINQNGIDFDGAGIYSLPGSAGRYRQSPSYVFASAEPILGEPR